MDSTIAIVGHLPGFLLVYVRAIIFAILHQQATLIHSKQIIQSSAEYTATEERPTAADRKYDDGDLQTH